MIRDAEFAKKRSEPLNLIIKVIPHWGMREYNYYLFIIVFSFFVLSLGNFSVFGEPSIITPKIITEYTEDKDGKIVDFPFLLLDMEKNDITCTPPSGSKFPIGTTRVVCQSKVLSPGGIEYLWHYAKNIPEGETPTIQVGKSFFVTVKGIIKDNFADVPKPPKVPNKKIDALLYDFLANPELFAQLTGIEYQDGKTRILVELTEPTSNMLRHLTTLGQVEIINPDGVQLEIPVDKIQELITSPFVKKIKFPVFASQDLIKSQGIKPIHSDFVNQQGVTGKKIKVAVIDFAFDTKNPEIFNNKVEEKSFRHDFGNGLYPVDTGKPETNHGTAVAEIITDVAPDAELYLLTASRESEFIEAVDYSITQNFDLITSSMGFVHYPADGSSQITKAIERSISEQIPFVTSSGNYAQQHWEGKFKDRDKDHWHEFPGNDEGLSFFISREMIENNYFLDLSLFWYTNSDEIYDFDLKLVGPEKTDIIFSANRQDSANDELKERIRYYPKEPGTYKVGVYYDGKGTPDATIEIFDVYSQNLEHSNSLGSVVVPKDGEGAIVVGALNLANYEVEPYSSRGPTNDNKIVPNLVAPDGVSTLAYGDESFEGTSAASPHVAGVVALLLEKNPQSSPNKIRKILEENTNDEILKEDNVSGSGMVDSQFILNLSQGKNIGWIKTVIDWWKNPPSKDLKVSDEELEDAIKYLIKKGYLTIPPTGVSDWVQNNPGLTRDDFLFNANFLEGIRHLNSSKIISFKSFQNIDVGGGTIGNSSTSFDSTAAFQESRDIQIPLRSIFEEEKLEQVSDLDFSLSAELLIQVTKVLESIAEEGNSKNAESGESAAQESRNIEIPPESNQQTKKDQMEDPDNSHTKNSSLPVKDLNKIIQILKDISNKKYDQAEKNLDELITLFSQNKVK